MNTMAIAPIKAGTMAKPPTIGPQAPRIACPSQAPMKPAIILPMTPPGMSLPMISPANQPIIPPMINDHRKLSINDPPFCIEVILIDGMSVPLPPATGYKHPLTKSM